MAGMTRLVIVQDTNVTQRYQELLRKLEAAGGQRLGRHVVHCRLFSRKTTTDGYSNQRMFMLRMSHHDDLVYAVLANERAKSTAPPSDNGLDGAADECALLECGLDGATVLQQVEIYVFKSDGQFEYSPCYTAAPLETLFDEFLGHLVPEERVRKPVESLAALFDKVGLPPTDYSLKHTALQYVAAFNILRKFDKPSARALAAGARAAETTAITTRAAADMEEEMALFGGVDPRFDVVDLDAAVLPPAFSTPPYDPLVQLHVRGRLLYAPAPVDDLKTGFRADDSAHFGDAFKHHQERVAAAEHDAQQQLDRMLSAAVVSPASSPAPHDDSGAISSASCGSSSSGSSAGIGSDGNDAGSGSRRKKLCQQEGCGKHDQGGGFCLAHGGGNKCQTPFCAFFNLRTCEEHGGSRRCGIPGCVKVALGAAALCCAHGGGRKCSVASCEKHDAGLGLCLAHGGGRSCTVEGCSKKQTRYGVCSGHGGRARCREEGCDKYDRGQGKCKSHGGGYFCKVEGCTKKDKGGGLCASHGGGKKCYVDGCITPCVGGGRCKLHGGGKRCQEAGCANWALNAGRCKEHGGTGRRCSRRGCDKHDQGGGYCLAHGGGYKCTVPGCSKKQIRFGRCCAHGGKPRCTVEGCERLSQHRGLCKAHGGTKPCDEPGCARKASSGGRCISHGGGGRCRTEGCTKTNRGGGHCKAHGGGKKCHAPGCNEWAIGGGACPQHDLFGASSVVCV
ncbi:hypothetical protein PybrP1_002468 [[Pythium] brassicae (nom. inval.)]|nr:hypothetical protein PybrP1_002468 [[Pythium] brassicae (nom. inval.)]